MYRYDVGRTERGEERGWRPSAPSAREERAASTVARGTRLAGDGRRQRGIGGRRR